MKKFDVMKMLHACYGLFANSLSVTVGVIAMVTFSWRSEVGKHEVLS